MSPDTCVPRSFFWRFKDQTNGRSKATADCKQSIASKRTAVLSIILTSYHFSSFLLALFHPSLSRWIQLMNFISAKLARTLVNRDLCLPSFFYIFLNNLSKMEHWIQVPLQRMDYIIFFILLFFFFWGNLFFWLSIISWSFFSTLCIYSGGK